MKDLEFKKIMQSKFGCCHKIGINADYVFKHNNIYCFECENSSRGLTSNLIKHLIYAKKYKNLNFLILFIRTKLHINKYKSDFEKFEFICQNIQFPNIKITSISMNSFKNLLDTSMKIKDFFYN